MNIKVLLVFSVVMLTGCVHSVDSTGSCLSYKSYVTSSDSSIYFQTTCIDWSSSDISELNETVFSSFINLETINLSNNTLTRLPEMLLKGQRQLKNLNVSNNLLRTLPVTIFHQKEGLEYADFSFNRIDTISSETFLYSLRRLRLNLSNNRLTALEPWGIMYDDENPIFRIDVSSNNISTITNTRNFTYNGRHLANVLEVLMDVRNNSFTTWHDAFFTQFQPSQPVIVTVAETLLDLRDNPWICDCNFHNFVKTLGNSVFKWANTDLLKFKCSEPPSLRHQMLVYDIPLHEFVCNITETCPAGCLCQDIPERQIVSVDCRGAGLTQFPEIVPVGKYGRIDMIMDNNNISKLDNTTYTKYIISFTIKNNSLQFISDSFMEDIAGNFGASVDFRYNKLQSVPESIQKIHLHLARLEGNFLTCNCEMKWMVDWTQDELSDYSDRKKLTCDFDGTPRLIAELTKEILCPLVNQLILPLVLTGILLIVIVLIITAHRCPYETKVLIFKLFRIHPSDKYVVDKTDGKDYDGFLSFDETDPYVSQWVMKVFLKKLENRKPKYKMAVPARDFHKTEQNSGVQSEARVDLMECSKRVLVILSGGYEDNEWCQYDTNQTETLERIDGRVIYILYDHVAKQMSACDHWASKMQDRKVFSLGERLFWDKLKYELPQK